ncbi:MAG TPA: hypothetical protein VMU01_07920 [Rhizomicrobium sp.]|nr:hypothetical protein [Rhizomicrobium sp.]
MKRTALAALLIGCAAWLFVVFGWFYLRDSIMYDNLIKIACGFPDTAAKSYAPCVDHYRATTSIWGHFFQRHWLWLFGPPAIAAALTYGICRFRRTSRSS